MSVGSDSSECGGNTDVPTSAFFWSRLPLFESLLYFPVTVSSSLWQSKLIGGHQRHGLTIGSAAWRILTVAKVLWMVSWLLDGLICCPSSLAWILRDDVGCVDRVKSQDSFRFLNSGPNSLHYHLLSEVVYGFRQHLLLRYDLHRLGILCTEHHLNLLPREIWQRLLLSTERPLVIKGKKRSGEKSSGSPSVQSSCRGKAMSTLQAQHIMEHRCPRSKGGGMYYLLDVWLQISCISLSFICIT